MKVTIIGRWGAYPAKGEATACYLVECDDLKIVVDVGSGSLAQLGTLIDLATIDVVFVSHIHADHIADLMTLQYAALVDTQLKRRKKKLQVFLYDPEESISYEFPDMIESHLLQPSSKITMKELTCTFFETNHNVPTLAMRLQWKDQVLVYTADTAYCEKLAQFARGADIYLTECSFYAAQQSIASTHCTSFDVAKMMNIAKAKQTILTHLPHYGEQELLVEEVKQLTNYAVQLAKPFMTKTIKGEVNHHAL